VGLEALEMVHTPIYMAPYCWGSYCWAAFVLEQLLGLVPKYLHFDEVAGPVYQPQVQLFDSAPANSVLLTVVVALLLA